MYHWSRAYYIHHFLYSIDSNSKKHISMEMRKGGKYIFEARRNAYILCVFSKLQLNCLCEQLDTFSHIHIYKSVDLFRD